MQKIILSRSMVNQKTYGDRNNVDWYSPGSFGGKVNEQPESRNNSIPHAFPKHFYMCGSAQTTMKIKVQSDMLDHSYVTGMFI